MSVQDPVNTRLNDASCSLNLSEHGKLVLQAKLTQDLFDCFTLRMEALMSFEMSVLFTSQHGVSFQEKNFIPINTATTA